VLEPAHVHYRSHATSPWFVVASYADGVKPDDDSQSKDPWRLNEEVRRRRLKEDGARPLSVNLAEAIALSEFFSTFAGSARRA
jgi:hypothetical protein